MSQSVNRCKALAFSMPSAAHIGMTCIFPETIETVVPSGYLS